MSLITSFTRAGSLNGIPWLETYPAPIMPGTGATAANQALLSRASRLSQAVAINYLRYYVGGASGNIDLGIYTWDGATGFTRVASTGSTASSGTNAAQIVALAAPVVLVPGVDYFLALAADNAVVTFGRFAFSAGAGAATQRCFTKASSFPLPASIASASTTASWLWLAATPTNS